MSRLEAFRATWFNQPVYHKLIPTLIPVVIIAMVSDYTGYHDPGELLMFVCGALMVHFGAGIIDWMGGFDE